MRLKIHTLYQNMRKNRILIHKSGGNDTSWDGNHSDSQERDKNAEHFSEGGDGINIAVPHGQQFGGGPPDSGKSVGEYIRLRLVFKTIHTKAGSQHQYQNSEHRGKELLLFA